MTGQGLLTKVGGPSVFAHVSGEHIANSPDHWEKLIEAYLKRALLEFDEESVLRILSTWLKYYTPRLDSDKTPTFRRFCSRVSDRVLNHRVDLRPYTRDA